jgi:hypothetical protein
VGLFSGLFDAFRGGSEDYYDKLNPPDIEAMKITLKQYVNQGILTPEDAQAVLQDPSAFEQITSDPAFKEAQMKALTGLQEVSDEGGMTAIDKARMNDIANQEGVQQRGAREAVMSNAAERGVSGSGMELLNQMKANQAGASDQSNRDTDVAAEAQRRALEALVQSGSMAGDIRGQDFSEASRKAQAADEINRFNTANSNAMNMWNVGNRNDAQRMNLANKQATANANVDMTNKQNTYNKSLAQQDYENRLRLAATKAGAYRQDEQRRSKGINDTEEGGAKIVASIFGLG